MGLFSWFKSILEKEQRTEVITQIPADESKPDWFLLAKKEIGAEEAYGPLNNPRILEYHDETSLNATKDSVPWCSSFICWVMENSDIKSTRSARARSWEKWGLGLKEPKLGCVVVFWRGSKRSGKGHVGLYAGEKNGYILVLGGNQKDAVNISKYSKKRLLGYRWPIFTD